MLDPEEEKISVTNRTHAITFRLAAREYEQLVKTVAGKGIRSLSEFTRTAVLNQMVGESLDRLLKDELDTLMNSLEEFDLKVRDLRRQLRRLAVNSESPIN